VTSHRAEPDPITLRIKARSPEPAPVPEVANVDPTKGTTIDYREEFWARVKRASPNTQASGWDQFEAKLVREFGPALKRKLIAHLQEPLKATGWLPDADLLNGMQPNPDIEDFYRATAYQEFIDFLEERKRRLDDKVSLAAFEKLAAAASLIFVVRIERYQSLSLALLVGSIEKLSQVFDGDAFNLKLFLGAFAAEAFGEVFRPQAANEFVFDAIVPESLAAIMSERRAQVPADQLAADARQPTSVRELAQQQAKVAWRYATTTMLIPVLLALTVTYFAFVEMRTISALRDKALESTLEHQLQLLREDRLRMTPPGDSSAKPGAAARDTGTRR
jgi:hypothetical protein